jgi:hypothetical protein
VARSGAGAIAGVLAGAVAVGAGRLVADITGPDGSPVMAVGRMQIDFIPPHPDPVQGPPEPHGATGYPSISVTVT